METARQVQQLEATIDELAAQSADSASIVTALAQVAVIADVLQPR
jgi:hypothetical protein